MNFRYSYKLSRKYITLRNPGRGNIEHLQHIKTMIDCETMIVADSALYTAKNLQLMSSIQWL